MSVKANPQQLLDQLLNATDVTPDKVREIVDAAVPVPPPTPAPSSQHLDLDVETSINYLKMNRR